jgi:hypothetical protein
VSHKEWDSFISTFDELPYGFVSLELSDFPPPCSFLFCFTGPTITALNFRHAATRWVLRAIAAIWRLRGLGDAAAIQAKDLLKKFESLAFTLSSLHRRDIGEAVSFENSQTEWRDFCSAAGTTSLLPNDLAPPFPNAEEFYGKRYDPLATDPSEHMEHKPDPFESPQQEWGHWLSDDWEPGLKV